RPIGLPARTGGKCRYAQNDIVFLRLGAPTGTTGESMSKPKVFVTRIIPDKGLDLVKEFCEVDLWQEELPPSREELMKRVQGVDSLLSLLTDQIDSEVMDAA